MAEFDYKAVKPGGEVVTGSVSAASRAQAFAKLDRDRLQPVSLIQSGTAHKAVKAANPHGSLAGLEADGTAVKAKKPPREKKKKPKNTSGEAMPELPEGLISATKKPAGSQSARLFLTRKQLILFTEEIADLLDAGLQLDQALQIMEKRRELGALKGIVSRLRRDVREGVSFSVALRSASKSFSDLYCNLVQAGELSGSLSRIMRQQSYYLKTIADLQSRVVSALIYPSFIIAAGVGLIFIFMTMLVPQLEDLFAQQGTTVPFLTQMLINSSKALATYWWLLAAVVILSVLGFWQFIQTKMGKQWWDEFKLRFPLYGPVVKAHFFAQFAHTLANLVGNGIPLHKGLQLVSTATGNVFIRGLLVRLTDIVGEGGLMSRGMVRVGWFPPLLCDMVSVGEQTGDLPHSLRKIADRYDKELNLKIQRLTTLIQPVIILVMAVIIGVVVWSILSGIFQAINSIGSGGSGG